MAFPKMAHFVSHELENIEIENEHQMRQNIAQHIVESEEMKEGIFEHFDIFHALQPKSIHPSKGKSKRRTTRRR